MDAVRRRKAPAPGNHARRALSDQQPDGGGVLQEKQNLESLEHIGPRFDLRAPVFRRQIRPARIVSSALALFG